jgi:hypothetical protein
MLTLDIFYNDTESPEMVPRDNSLVLPEQDQSQLLGSGTVLRSCFRHKGRWVLRTPVLSPKYRVTFSSSIMKPSFDMFGVILMGFSHFSSYQSATPCLGPLTLGNISLDKDHFFFFFCILQSSKHLGLPAVPFLSYQCPIGSASNFRLTSLLSSAWHQSVLG